jgi:imidazole glycerol-phosphate synthase subunit HisH
MSTKKIVILDYGLGNLFSIVQALKAVGAEAIVSNNPELIKNASGLLLPGVGAFGNAIEKLKSLNLIEPIVDYVKDGKPIMGICLGMQLLFQSSDEFGDHRGLELIEGKVEKLPSKLNGVDLRIPFMGWNKLEFNKDNLNISYIKNVSNNDKIYLVHSYYVVPKDPTIVLANCDYHGFKYPTIIKKDNIFAIQGHPEKSSDCGLEIFKSWLDNI